MDYFHYQNDTLFAENINLKTIAQQFGTPTFVYSKKTIKRHYDAFDNALGEHPHLICYAVKACSNIAILHQLAKWGAGFDVVSKGELFRVLKAGGSAKKVVFSGVGKTEDEMIYALNEGILCFNVESVAELEKLQTIAKKLNKKAPVSLRINPDVDAKTHPYISTGLKENKFGIEAKTALSIYKNHKNYSHLSFIGIDCHIGSQLTEVSPFLDALDKLLEMIGEIKSYGLDLHHLDLGGGLGVTYDNEKPPLPNELASLVKEKLKGHALTLILEPGRAIMANAGVLLTKVLYLKPHHEKNFAIVDAAMNDLIRPSLYQAYQQIINVDKCNQTLSKSYDIVGPVCETGDFLGKDRNLSLKPDDILAIRGAGAYGFSMSSNYNSRGKACEVLVDEDKIRLIHQRESLEDLIKNEIL